MWVYAAGNPALGLEATELSARIVVAYTDEVLRRYADSRGAPEDELAALFNEIVAHALEHGDVGALDHVPYDNAKTHAEQQSRIAGRARNALSRLVYRVRMWRMR